MLTLFRKIRKSLITTGSGRYFLYALGEIALVVIGILIALQINNWNEWKKDRVKEREILAELKINIEQNISYIENHVNWHLKEAKSAEVILDVVNRGLPWNDSLAIHFSNALLSHVPTVSSSAFESLTNKGVDLILSDTIRKVVVDLYENFNHLNTVMTRVVHTELKPNSIPFIIKNFVKEPVRLSSAGALLIPNNFKELSKNQELVNIIKYLQAWRKGYSDLILTTCLEKSRTVINLIKKELGEE